MSTLLTIALVGMALFACFSVFKIVPDCFLSMYRYRLWRLRDEIYDEIRRGEYRDTKQSEKFLADIECFIRQAGKLSPLNIALLFLSARGVIIPPNPFSLEGLSPQDRERLGRHVEAFNEATAKKVLLGTPSGWLTLLVLMPFAAAFALADLLRRDGDGEFRRETRQRVSEGSRALVNNQPRHHHSEPLSHAV